MTHRKTKRVFLRQTGNAVVVILVIVAGIAAGIFLFSRYDAQQAADSDDAAFPEISEEADVESMRERLERIRDDREEQEGDAALQELPEDEAEGEGPVAVDDEETGHADERGEATDPYGPTGPGGGGATESSEDEPEHVAYSGTRLAGTAELPMLRFNQADYDRAVAANETIVLMFHADWCPLCQAEEPDSRAAFDELAAQDVDGAVGFRVHFQDSETTQGEKNLAAQYNVQFQNSKIIVSNGNVVSSASYETWSTSRYKSEIQAAI